MVAPLQLFDETDGLVNVLTSWGGESINWASHQLDDDGSAARELLARVSALATPTVAEVGVKVSRLPSHPELWKIAVGVRAGLGDPSHEWEIEDGDPVQVLALIQPGDRRWRASWLWED